MTSTPLTSIPGIGQLTAERLIAVGIRDAEALLAAPAATIESLPGFHATRTSKVLTAARKLIDSSAPPMPGDGQHAQEVTGTLKSVKKSKKKAKKADAKKTKKSGKAKAKKKQKTEKKKKTSKKRLTGADEKKAKAKKKAKNKEKAKPPKKKADKGKAKKSQKKKK